MAPVLPCKKFNRDFLKVQFLLAYSSAIVQDGHGDGIGHQHSPNVYFTADGLEALRELAQARQKNWGSTRRLHPDAELTGLAGELAVYRYFKIPFETAFELYWAGINGDSGYDLKIGSESFDIKSTITNALDFKFSKTNRHRNAATAIIFCHVEFTGNGLNAVILGAAQKHKIVPFRREAAHFYRARFYTLMRQGIVHPVSVLLAKKGV